MVLSWEDGSDHIGMLIVNESKSKLSYACLLEIYDHLIVAYKCNSKKELKKHIENMGLKIEDVIDIVDPEFFKRREEFITLVAKNEGKPIRLVKND